jgi:hypothetical protein
MAQKRRTVSMSRLLYAQLREFCVDRGIPIAAFVEVAVLDAMRNSGDGLARVVADRGFHPNHSAILLPRVKKPQREVIKRPAKAVKPVETRKLETYDLDDSLHGIRLVLRDTFDVESTDIHGDSREEVERKCVEWLSARNYGAWKGA